MRAAVVTGGRAGRGVVGRDAGVEVSPAVVPCGVRRGGSELGRDGEEPDASQERGDGEAPAPHGEEASRPVCEEVGRPVGVEASRPVRGPRTNPRGGDG